MKRWIGAGLVGCAGVALWLLPLHSYATSGRSHVPSEEQRAEELKADLKHAQIALQRLQWSDSLPTVALAEAKDGLVLSSAPGLLKPDQRSRIESLLEAEVSRLERRQKGAVVGLVVQPADFAWPAGPTSTGGRDEIYIGSRGAHPYCLQVFATPGPLLDWRINDWHWRGVDGKSYSNVLGACRLVAEYGLPGPGVRAWLERDATMYAADAGQPAAREAFARANLRGSWPFGYRYNVNGSDDVRGDACRAGRVQSCASVFLDPAAGARDRWDSATGAEEQITGVLTGGRHAPLGYFGGFLVSDMERAFGPARFHAFWTSRDDVPAAFQAAFGRPLDEWLMGWVERNENMTTAGPALSAGDTFGGVLLLALAALVGVAWARRRRVT